MIQDQTRCKFQLGMWRCADVQDHQGSHNFSVRTACGAQLRRGTTGGWTCLRPRNHAGDHSAPFGDWTKTWVDGDVMPMPEIRMGDMMDEPVNMGSARPEEE